ncbi:ATP-binding protein [Chamaesiphon sp. VAR_69_metabat_338]|uniref:ATP-binding protein n=1 Tax=Chamaesiphon sp. VAR_69_metabat_338 TaxID=2964704 RepID=UPI00286E2D52|nr:ATP-binding protein [Chamaesiphon sp. VAR_69_metabat_338]
MPEDAYNSEQIQVISGIEGVRKRPGMYFDRTDSFGTEQFVYELVSNTLDCYLAGTATFVSVEIDEGNITVVDDGLGLPFDRSSNIPGMSLATEFLTVLHSTGSRDGHAPHVHTRNIHGVGLAILNAASSQMKIQSWRDGVLWEQRFERGVPLYEQTIIDRGTGRGTRIEVTPDPELFPGSQPRLDVVRRNLFETAHLVKGIEIRLNRERFYAPQGLVQLLPFMGANVNLDDRHNSFLPFHTTVKSDRVLIDAVAYGSITSKQPIIYSWVNGGVSAEDGSHVNGFLKALQQVNWQPALVLIHVVMFDPEFAGPTKTKLVAPKIAKIVRGALREPLEQYCDRLGSADPRRNP